MLESRETSETAEEADLALEPDSAAELVGGVVGGRYRITRIIGRGGMGVVYAGEHLELGLGVAIKVLPASYARDAEMLKRFEREARTASRVRHPNVVTVFDFGRLPTGEPYLVMELLVGRDLSDLVEPGQALPLREVIDIVGPLAVALDALHAEGVVHRDVKPSNMFFSEGKGRVDTLKLVDFGLAALHSTGGDSRLTRVGQVVGTAAYMAPEAGRGTLVGPAGDIYALGVVAFELLTGHVPFDGLPMSILMDKLSVAAPTLARVSGRPFDADLEAALASALARDPGDRPPTAVAVVDAMRAVLKRGSAARSDPPPLAPGSRRPPPPPRIRGAGVRDTSSQDLVTVPPPPRRRFAVPAVLGTALVLVAASILYAQPWAATAIPPAALARAPLTAAIVLPIEVPVAVVSDVPIVVAAPEPEPTPLPSRPMRARASARSTPTLAVAVVPAPAAPTTTATTPETPGHSTDRTPQLLRDASSAMLHGQIPHARQLYGEATLASPRDAAAWRGLGLASERMGLLPEARRAYGRYLELAPEARDASTVRDRLARLGS